MNTLPVVLWLHERLAHRNNKRCESAVELQYCETLERSEKSIIVNPDEQFVYSISE